MGRDGGVPVGAGGCEGLRGIVRNGVVKGVDESEKR